MSDKSESQRDAHRRQRLQNDLIAWMTTVDPEGQPHAVPVWFLHQADDTILVYSQPGKRKLDAIRHNPRVALGLDGTDEGKDVVRVEGTASIAADAPPATENADFVTKYAELAAATFGQFDRFANMFSVAVIVTPKSPKA